MKDLIKNILKEEVEDKKVKLVIEFVRSMNKGSNLISIFDYVIREYDNRPLVVFHYRPFEKLEDTEKFITKRTCDKFNSFWSDSVIIAPFWFPKHDKTFFKADVLIDFWEMS